MKKIYPKLRFIISKQKELNTYLAFLDESKYRDNPREMNWGFYDPHPKLKILKDKNLSLSQIKKIIKEYIDNYYLKNISKIKKNLEKEKNNWKKLEKDFYYLTDKIFKNHKWPRGRYIAYPTIWGIYPRFLEDKTFQIPIEHRLRGYVQTTIAHEMLHFIFYDYIYKKYPKLKNHKYDDDLWNISEAFNVIIQNSPEWLKVFNQKTMSYPEHKDLIKKFKGIWKDVDEDIDKFLAESLRVVGF